MMQVSYGLTTKSYIYIYIYKEDLELNNPQGCICLPRPADKPLPRPADKPKTYQITRPS